MNCGRWIEVGEADGDRMQVNPASVRLPRSRCVLDAAHGGECDDGAWPRAICGEWFATSDAATIKWIRGESHDPSHAPRKCDRFAGHGGVHGKLPGTCGRAVPFLVPDGQKGLGRGDSEDWDPCVRDAGHPTECASRANTEDKPSPFDAASNKAWRLEPVLLNTGSSSKEWVGQLHHLFPTRVPAAATWMRNLTVTEATLLIDVLTKGCSRIDGERVTQEPWIENACDALKEKRFSELLEMLKSEGVLDEAMASVIGSRDREIAERGTRIQNAEASADAAASALRSAARERNTLQQEVEALRQENDRLRGILGERFPVASDRPTNEVG